MASTATTRLRLEKMADGENDGTWGPKMTAVLDRVDEAVAGSTAVATTGGTTTLTSNNFTSDEARAAILEVTGTLASNATIRIPAVSKLYVVDNSTSGSFTVTVEVSGGTGAVVPQGEVRQVKCDGTDCALVGSGSATATQSGIVELATSAEAETGTDTARAVTPAGVVASINANSAVSVVEAGALSSQATLDIGLGTADMYEIDLISVLPQTDAQEFQALFSQSSTFLTGAGDYGWGTNSGSIQQSASDTEIGIISDVGSGATEGLTVTVRIFRPSAASFLKRLTTFGGYWDASSSQYFSIVGSGTLLDNTDAIDGVRFLFASGNIASGYYAVRSYSFT